MDRDNSNGVATIPQRSIDHLIANPSVAPQFDNVFGEGRAEEVLGAQRETASQVKPESSTDDDDWTYLGEAYRALTGSVRDAVTNTANFAQMVDREVNDLVFGEGKALTIGTDGIQVMDREDTQFLFGDGGRFELPDVAPNETLVGSMARGVGTFAIGYGAAAKLTKLKGIKGMFLNEALASAVVMNPDDPNVTRILEDFGVDTGAVGVVLATDPEDPEYINRLRNVAEGAVTAAVLEALGWGVRAYRYGLSGDTQAAQAAKEAQQEALKVLDEAAEEAANVARKDVTETLDLKKKVFDAADMDPEGQLKLNLGDAPRPRPSTDASPKRIFLTPERVEKIRLQEALARGVDAPTKWAQTSFRSPRTQSSFDQVEDEIAAVSSVMADEFAKLKGGNVQRWQQVQIDASKALREMTKITGQDPEELIADFADVTKGDVTQLAARIHAQSRYVLTLEQELKKMARVINDAASGKPTNFDEFEGINDLDQLRLAFHQNREIAVNLLGQLDANRSNVARAMNAMKMSKEGDEGLRKAIVGSDGLRGIDEAAKAVVDAGDDASAIRTATDTVSKIKDVADRINTFRINALLSGPGTQEVNLISNAIQSVVIPVGQLAGAAVTADRKVMFHALRQLRGMYAAALDVQHTWKAVKQAGWTDEAILDPFNGKIEEDSFGKITGNQPLDTVMKLPSRFLMTMDELFKQSSYRGRIYADAVMEAEESGLKGTAKTDYVKKYLKDSYTDTGAALREEALLQARRSTFTEPLDDEITRAIQHAAIKSPPVRFILPFVRTPINILSQTFQHLPVVGMLSKRFRGDLAAGGVRAAQARGRQAIGTSIMLTAGFLAAEGRITGSGPSDPRVRKHWLRNNQPYAIRFDNEDGTVRWVSYARLEPLSSVFAITADMVEITNDEYNESDVTNMGAALFMAIMENTVNKTFTQGISDLMEIMTDGGGYEAERAINNMLASFSPNLLNQTNGDKAFREARSLSDTLRARTGLYNQVDPKRDIFGRIVMRPTPKWDPLGLFHEDVREIDPVMQVLTEQSIITQTAPGLPNRKLPGPNRINLSEIPYTDGQSLYDKWIELSGEVTISGRTMYEAVERLINSESFKRAPEGDIGVSSRTKGHMLRRVIEGYRKKAKAQLPELREAIKSEQLGTGHLLKNQIRRNRELFPPVDENYVPRRRTFEDLLK